MLLSDAYVSFQSARSVTRFRVIRGYDDVTRASPALRRKVAGTSTRRYRTHSLPHGVRIPRVVFTSSGVARVFFGGRAARAFESDASRRLLNSRVRRV